MGRFSCRWAILRHLHHLPHQGFHLHGLVAPGILHLRVAAAIQLARVVLIHLPHSAYVILIQATVGVAHPGRRWIERFDHPSVIAPCSDYDEVQLMYPPPTTTHVKGWK